MPDEIKWIKLSTDFFWDRKIKQIRAMPDGDAMLLIWINLLVLAGLVNDGGLVYLTRGIPYTEEMLAEEMQRSLPVVRSAISLFRTLNMVEDTPDGLLISNWEKHQSVDGMERAKQKTRERVRRFREREAEKKALPEPESPDVTDCNATDSYAVTPCNADVTVQNKNKKENKKEDSLSFSDENDCRANLRLIAEKWNEIGVHPVKTITAGTTRGKMILARVREHGLDAVLQAIEIAKRSPFLRGENNRGWMITLEWFAKPNNFIKVREGQYLENRSSGVESKSSADRIMQMIQRGDFQE